MGMLLLALPAAVAPVYVLWRDHCDRADKERAVRPEIERRAYEIWQQRGGVGGNADDDWNKAKVEIMSERGWL